MPRSLLWGVALFLFGAGATHATTVRAASVAELTKQSELVFRGRVTDVRSRLEPAPDGAERVWTDVDFVVEAVWHGEPGPKDVRLTQLGGEVVIDGRVVRQKIHGYAVFAMGERVVLFVERTDTGRQVVTGLALGKYRIVAEADGREIAARDLDELNVVGPRLRTLAGVPSDENRLPLAQLEALVRGKPVAGHSLHLVRDIVEPEIRTLAPKMPPSRDLEVTP